MDGAIRGHSGPAGLVLAGGGARGAYQAGVLKALAAIRREASAAGAVGAAGGNPFPVIAGTSAGAINGAALACGADDFDDAVAHLVGLWSGIHAERVYRSDAIGVLRSGARWVSMLTAGWALARWRYARPRSLLDNAPLADLLRDELRLERLPALMRDGHLKALAVSASSYTSGHHVTFYDAVGEIRGWTRSQRLALPAPLTVEHLLASSAIPFVFPATRLPLQERMEWFGDGAMRQAAPISPAIHLGAERVLIVGAGRLQEPEGERAAAAGYPSLAQIAGHALSSIFLDTLAVDIERLQRINRTLDMLPPALREQHELKPIDVLIIAPSQRLDDIAARHVTALPGPVRALLRSTGVRQAGDRPPSGSALASYLLFEPSFTLELIALGEHDTFERRADVLRFFGWERRDSCAAAMGRLQSLHEMSPASSIPAAQAAQRVDES